MTRTGISYAKYGSGVKLFRTEDDIEARSDDIFECNIPVRAFPGWSNTGAQGFDLHTSFTFPHHHWGQCTTPQLETPCK
jgi:hypothetical protein